MKFLRLVQVFLSACAILLLMLFVTANGVDVERHDQIVDHLRQLKELDAMLNQHLLKLRYGLLPNYETAVRTVVDLRSVRHDLMTGPLAVYRRGEPEVDRCLEAYGEVLRKKSSLIDHFASQYKALDRTLQNFPPLVTEISTQISAVNPDDPSSALLASLLQKVLLFNLTVGEELKVDIIRILNVLANLHDQRAPPLTEQLFLVIAQAQLIVTQKENIDAQVADFVSLPGLQWLERLQQAYATRYNRATRRADVYRLGLCALCFLLLSSLGYIMLKLRDNMSLLDRRTKEITQTNTRLETEIEERRRIQQRLVLQYAVTRVLAESMTLNAAAPRMLHAICEHLGWVFGGIWCRDPQTQALRCVHSVWYRVERQAGDPETVGSGPSVPGDAWLPNRVQDTGTPVWIPDIVHEPTCSPGSSAVRGGLHGALAFPVRSGTQLMGVMAFFSQHTQPLNEDLLQMLTAMGLLVGQFIGHRQLERDRQEKSEALLHSNRELTEQQEMMHRLLEDLQASNTKLQELGLLKDEFVAKVSHELRTPLTSIKEGLSLFLDNALGRTTPEQQDFLKTMDADIDRLAELINNMLDIAKIEAGRMQLIRARVAVPEFVASVVRSCQPIIGRRTVNIECAPVSPVFVDRNRMLQVLTNLCSNAIKATAEDGSISFRVSQQGSLVLIAVEDNGAGIAAEDLPKLFEKFSQVGMPTTRQFGTGLGLTVCKELTELHGGRIKVSSQVGRGTTFTVLLPAYSDPLALTESFREIRSSTPLLEGQVVGMMAIYAEALLTPGDVSRERRQQLDRIAEDVRRNVHRGDIVLTLEPSWIVVLAVVEPPGLKTIMTRLQSKLRVSEHLRFGVAVYPTDGADATTLFACATARSDRGVEWLKPPEGPRLPSVKFTR